MNPIIKFKQVIDRTDLPKEIKECLDALVYCNYVISGNSSYIVVDIAEYRECTSDEYLENYGPDKAIFMEWLEKQTSADEMLILY